MTDDDFEIRLARHLRKLAPEPAWDFRDRVMAELANVPQQGRGIAGWLPIPPNQHRFALILATAALLVGLVAGAIAVGSGLIKLPSVIPAPSHLAVASAEPLPSISAEPTPREPLGLVAYNVTELVDPAPATCTPGIFHPWCSDERIWVSNSDGTAAHELLPDVPGDQSVIAWSPDGSRLMYSDERSNLVLTDLAGVDLQLIPYESLCSVANCPNLDGFAFSPDRKQQYLYVVDSGPMRVVIFDRETLTQIGAIGIRGPKPGDFDIVHHMAADSKGNLYTAEIVTNRRAQRFVLTSK
jgi:hypothetical protein